MEIIETSAETKNVFTAIFKARARMEPAKKDAENDHFRSKYATLNSVLAACQPALESEGVLLMQFPVACEKPNVIRLVTRLEHVESGEHICCTTDIPLQPQMQHPQGMGSAVTYARRYAIVSLLGIPTEDDDGNAATWRAGDTQRVRRAMNKDAALARMWRLLEGRFANDSAAKLDYVREITGCDIKSSADMSEDQIKQVIQSL